MVGGGGFGGCWSSGLGHGCSGLALAVAGFLVAGFLFLAALAAPRTPARALKFGRKKTERLALIN